jgi:hypothetical protein
MYNQDPATLIFKKSTSDITNDTLPEKYSLGIKQLCPDCYVVCMILRGKHGASELYYCQKCLSIYKWVREGSNKSKKSRKSSTYIFKKNGIENLFINCTICVDSIVYTRKGACGCNTIQCTKCRRSYKDKHRTKTGTCPFDFPKGYFMDF